MRFASLLLALMCAGATAVSVSAQQTGSIAPDPQMLAKYDKNGNGRLDPDELAAMQADQAKAAQAPVATTASSADKVVELSPFEVTEDNHGYYAANTMSGTRLNAKIEDLGSSISVVTKEQMKDFAMLDINDIFNYEASTEGTGNYTDFSIDRNGMATDNIQNNPQGANRIRGVGAANIALNNFATSGRVPIDPIGIDSVEISRGPNANIFGLGTGSGTVNLNAATANFNRESSTVEARMDSIGGYRTSLDLNRPLIHGKLAIRGSMVFQHDAYNEKPSGGTTRRYNAMLRAQPFKNTSIRA
jgi:outer membrane receptor for ferric coprogen and ferric-rhodotorulic acid